MPSLADVQRNKLVELLCCLTNKVTTTPAPAAASVDLWAASASSNVPFSLAGDLPLFTSIEVENFSDTYWLQVILPVLETGFSLFWVPPGGSKVLAVSAPLFPASGTITVYDTYQGFATAPTTEFGVQITLLKGS